jgi:hypothetical protein
VTTDENGDEPESGLSAAQAEREAMYPEEGYTLVAIDYNSRPGDALSRRGTYDSLEEIDMPSDTEFTGYVVYDSDGVAYSQDDIPDSH